jgi:ABC-2 type transport system permease protein
VSALTRLTRSETKLFFREPAGVFFTIVFPPLLLVILGLVPDLREADPALGGMRRIDLFATIIITMALTLFALSGLPQALATYRDKGVLRRMRTTPVKPVMMLGAQLLSCVAMSVAVMVAMVAIGRVVFDVPLPRELPAYLVGYLLAALAMFALGLLVAALAPSGKAASGIGTLLFFPVMFFAGLWVPRAEMSDLLRTISDFTPLGAGVQSLSDAAAGHWPQLLHVAVMLGWTIVAGGLAARYFRWE